MHTYLRTLILSITLAALSLNLLFYTSQRYAPPRADSLSYSILDCPSHQKQHQLSLIMQFFTGQQDEGGTGKHCFCYSCCNQRDSFAVGVSASELIPEHHSVYGITITKLNYPKDFCTSLPIRSPPIT